MRRRLLNWILAAARWLRPQPTAVEIELARSNRILTERAVELAARNDDGRREYMERVSELVEARQMAGSGPWTVGPAALAQTDALIQHAYESAGNPTKLREAIPISAGATGLTDMLLANLEWVREGAWSQLEFSRWGIQQIILICRLYYIKNPIVRRLVDVCAAYVFARGVEISSPDEDVNAEIDDYLRANPKTLGHRALIKAERAKDTDGNLFYVSFNDTESTGSGKLRRIEATEIDEIVTNPEDATEPWYYHRIWTQKTFDQVTGSRGTQTVKKWYPALNFAPDNPPQKIGADEVLWKSPVHHSKDGEVGQWLFGCPRAYPAKDWASEARKYLEACASQAQSNAQISRDISTKGGQQAIEGIKQQMSTTVGPGNPLLEQNPTAVAGSTFVHGPGMKMEVVKTRGAGNDPNDVRRLFQMCCMVWGVPLTFLGDTMDGSMATALSLDRPTETVMMEKQEAWHEDLMVLVLHHLEVSKAAPRGRLREALDKRGIDPGKVTIRECARVKSKDGKRMVYATLERRKDAAGVMRLHEADRPLPDTELVVRVNFPAIREGDLKTLVDATVEAMTLGNRAGQVIGIDEKEGTRKLYDLLDFDDGDELTEKQYPEGEYEPDRTKEKITAPITKPPALAGGQDAVNPVPAQERAIRRLARAFRLWEAQNPEVSNGHEHTEHR